LLDSKRIFELYSQGLSTGKIALAIGLPRIPNSRRKIRDILATRETVVPHLRKKSVEEFVELDQTDKHIRRSTGHRFYPDRRTEAEFILEQFYRNYKRGQLKKRKIIGEVANNLDNVTPRMLFELRNVYTRAKKLWS
jgi:hypothetical protein